MGQAGATLLLWTHSELPYCRSLKFLSSSVLGVKVVLHWLHLCFGHAGTSLSQFVFSELLSHSYLFFSSSIALTPPLSGETLRGLGGVGIMGSE